MKCWVTCVVVGVSFFSVTCFGAKEKTLRFQNTVRMGYDDNIYNSDSEKGSGFITDIVNITSKFNFSTRTDGLIYWQPEFQYRFDADPEFISYQDIYAKLNHAWSSRVFITLADRFRYQLKDGQTGGGLGGPASDNQNYFENDLNGAIDYTINSSSTFKLGGAYLFRVWDEKSYGKGTANNDFEEFTASGTYIRDINPNKTDLVLGLNLADLEYSGSRGGYDSITGLIGVDQIFNPESVGFVRAGLSAVSSDNRGVSDDSTSPYLSCGLDYKPSARTSLNGMIGYSNRRSDNSIFSVQDQFSITLGGRHDITAKINLASTISFIHSQYDAISTIPDAKDDYFTFNLRSSYQINRNNFVELGYRFRSRSADSILKSEWDGNRIDAGWRLRL